MNFYTFEKYAKIEDEATRENMQYFATQKHESAKMQRIHALVEQYRNNPDARKAYMTLEQEFNIRYNKGVKDGLAEGHAEGLAEGSVEGRAEGAEATKKELAKALRERNIAIEIIAETTGLSPEEIKAL